MQVVLPAASGAKNCMKKRKSSYFLLAFCDNREYNTYTEHVIRGVQGFQGHRGLLFDGVFFFWAKQALVIVQ